MRHECHSVTFVRKFAPIFITAELCFHTSPLFSHTVHNHVLYSQPAEKQNVVNSSKLIQLTAYNYKISLLKIGLPLRVGLHIPDAIISLNNNSPKHGIFNWHIWMFRNSNLRVRLTWFTFNLRTVKINLGVQKLIASKQKAYPQRTQEFTHYITNTKKLFIWVNGNSFWFMSQKTALYQLTRKSRKKNITSHNQNDHLGKVIIDSTHCRTELSTLDSVLEIIEKDAQSK